MPSRCKVAIWVPYFIYKQQVWEMLGFFFNWELLIYRKFSIFRKIIKLFSPLLLETKTTTRNSNLSLMQWLFNKEETKWERERKKVYSELGRRTAKQWWRDVKDKETEMQKEAEIQTHRGWDGSSGNKWNPAWRVLNLQPF